MRKLPPLKIWRTLIPAIGLAITIVLFSRYRYPLPPDSEMLLWYTRLDPLLLLSQLRTGHLPGWAWVPLITMGLTFLFGRFFCGWICPLGGLLALLQAVRKKNLPNPAWLSHFSSFRMPWFLFLLLVLLFGSGWPLYLTPFHLLTEGLSRIWRQQVPWMLLLVVVLGLTFFPRFWCVYLCPTGLLLSFLSRWRVFRAKPPAACIHCGRCEKICPTQAAIPAAGITSDDCLLCGRCSEQCPAGYFELTKSASPGTALPVSGCSYTRREVLRTGTALVMAGAVTPLLTRPAGANPLRPPGAVEEDDFLSLCSRCGRCIKVCPSQCISPMTLTSGAGLFLTPHIVPRQARCELCQQCQQVCPTGAIAHVPIPSVLMGRAVIDQSRCLGWTEGKLCLVCKEQCPQHAIDSDSRHRPSVQKQKCVGCGGCENACPVNPAAIVVQPQPKRRHKKAT